MDDRLAARIYENNIVTNQKGQADRISLLEKLAVQSSTIQNDVGVGIENPPDGPPGGDSYLTISVKDEFITRWLIDGGLSLDILTSELTWFVHKGTSITLGAGSVSTEHYGIMNITNATGDIAAVYLNGLLYDMPYSVKFIGKFSDPTTAGAGFMLGFLTDPSSAFLLGGNGGMYFMFENGDTNWSTITCDAEGGSATSNDSGVPFVADTWYLFEIQRTAPSTYLFLINGVPVSIHTTNIDVADLLFPLFGMLDVTNNSSIGCTIDYFSLSFETTAKRWD